MAEKDAVRRALLSIPEPPSAYEPQFLPDVIKSGELVLVARASVEAYVPELASRVSLLAWLAAVDVLLGPHTPWFAPNQAWPLLRRDMTAAFGELNVRAGRALVGCPGSKAWRDALDALGPRVLEIVELAARERGEASGG